MHISIIKITLILLIAISNTSSLAMMVITNNYKNRQVNNFKRFPKGLQFGLKRSQEELKAEKQKRLLIEAAPLESALEKAYVSADILITIGARANDEIKDQLRATCRFMAKKISIKSSSIGALVANPLFHTNNKNIQFIALNAAWDGDYKTLENLLEKLPPLLEIYYEYPVSENMKCHFHISDVVAGKKIIYGSEVIAENTDNGYWVWDAINALLKKYNMELTPYAHRCTELMMACYKGDITGLSNYLVNNKNTQPELFCVEVKKCLWIAINRNKPDCIGLLTPHIKKCDYDDDNFESFWEVLLVAMMYNKTQSFESLVAHDIYGRLNFSVAHQTILDRIINWESTQGKSTFYSDRYKELGGKSYAELK